MGKPNWATWFHRQVAADERVDVIRQELSQRRPNGSAHCRPE
jgi:hypothetical protein